MSLELREITFRYGKKEPAILEAFSAVFEKNDITAVLGPNGVGKTTLSKIIMGILKAEDGSIWIDDQCMDSFSLAQRGKAVGYVMQNPARQIFSATVQEEMTYGLANLGLKPEEICEKSREFLSIFDLTGYEDTFPFHLSHGEKQRLVLAAVLSMVPEYLLLDEPTSGLDQRRKQQLGGYLDKVRKEKGCGIIVISHDLKFVEQYAQKQVLMGGEDDA